MFHKLDASPTWLDRWNQPAPYNGAIIRAYSLHPRFSRWADWRIDAALDANLTHALERGHSIVCFYYNSNDEYVPLPYVWTLAYAAHFPSLSNALKVIKEGFTENKP
jgi:hypothetical protein